MMLRMNEISQIWEYCCSYKCYGLQLEKLLTEMTNKRAGGNNETI